MAEGRPRNYVAAYAEAINAGHSEFKARQFAESKGQGGS